MRLLTACGCLLGPEEEIAGPITMDNRIGTGLLNRIAGIQTKVAELIVVALAGWLAATGPTSAMDLQPKTFPLSVMGVKVSVPVMISFDVNTLDDKLLLHVRVSGELEICSGQCACNRAHNPHPKGKLQSFRAKSGGGQCRQCFNRALRLICEGDDFRTCDSMGV